MNESNESVNDKGTALKNLHLQIHLNETMGVKQMYETTAINLGATHEEIRELYFKDYK